MCVEVIYIAKRLLSVLFKRGNIFGDMKNVKLFRVYLISREVNSRYLGPSLCTKKVESTTTHSFML